MKLRFPFSSKPKALTELDWESLWDTSAKAKSGVTVNATTAYASAALSTVILIRSETAATLPVDVMRERDGKREKATDHPAHRLLKYAPNRSQVSATFWLWQQQTTDMLGNAWVRIESRGTKLNALHPLTGRCEPIIETVNGVNHLRGVKHTKGGVEEIILASDLLHFPSSWISEDGITGRSIVDVARESIGLDIGAQEFFARVMANGTHMGTVLVADEALTDAQVTALQAALADGRGIAPANKVRVFQKVKPMVLGTTVKDADLTEARRLVREGICTVGRVPIVMVDPTHGTYSNVEQGDIALAKHCIRPICVVREQVLSSRLLANQPDLYVKFDLNGLMRGDFKTRMEGYAQAVNAGITTPNRVLALEDEDPIPGGDVLRFPVNCIPAEDAGSTIVRSSVESAGALVRAGYDPIETLGVVGLPEIGYNDVQPVTVRPVDEDGIQLAPAKGEEAMSTLTADAAVRIRIRAEQDAKNGRTPEQTREFAHKVTAPLEQVAAQLNVEFDAEGFITDIIGGN